ncbi:hypothetical protein PRUPE_2G164000 [Prunus persica]|uniref:Uncharacterized protein n=1 Tax=Prunus persica TaxID=3760 RepID=A0A251QGR0_PRUPE|nr:hypothetical protein PRUPE_2G164000 [Prunus persica]
MGCASATHDTRTYHVYFVCNLYLSIYLICEITIFINKKTIMQTVTMSNFIQKLLNNLMILHYFEENQSLILSISTDMSGLKGLNHVSLWTSEIYL